MNGDLEDAVKRLESLGLSAVEARTYLRLLDGPAGPADIAGDLGISRQRAERLLRSLGQKGLANRRPSTKGARYAATPPGWTLPTYLHSREEELGAARRLVAELTDRYDRAGEEPAAEYIEVALGRDAVLAQGNGIESAARSEILGFSKPPVMSSENPGEIQALKRGVRNRWLWERSLLEEPGGLELASSYARAGEEIRVTSFLPAKIVIADSSVAVIQVTEDIEGSPRFAGLLTRHPEVVATLRLTFEMLWERATPLMLEGGNATDEPDRDTARLISCLSSGLSDAAIARQLGVSSRTVTRRITELFESLGVETRFQAGMKLAGSAHDGANEDQGS